MIVLVTWLWQGLAVALATAVLLECARTLNAATRHAMWWLACAAVLSLPFACVLAARSFPGAATSPAAVPLPAAPDWFLAFALLAWVVFAAAGLLRVARSVATVFRLKRAGQPLDSALASRLEWRAAARRQPQLRVWDGANGACALGLGRPVILLSRSLVDRLDDDDLNAIVMHERAHLERHDDWWQVLQAIVAAMVGWHPAVWFIGRRISLEREAACDDHVLALTGAARHYARALVEAAVDRRSSRSGFDRLAIPGAATSGLRCRIRRLLDARLDRGTRPALGASLIGVAALAGAMAGAVRMPAIVVFVEAVTNVPRVERPSAHDSRAVLPRLMVPSVDAPAPPAPLKTRVTQPARSAPLALAVAQVDPSDAVTGRLQPHASSGSTLADPASLAPAPPLSTGETGPPAPVLASRTPWGMVARSAASTGHGLARSGGSTGDRVRNAGLSIGRFFTSAGKGVVGRF